MIDGSGVFDFRFLGPLLHDLEKEFDDSRVGHSGIPIFPLCGVGEILQDERSPLPSVLV